MFSRYDILVGEFCLNVYTYLLTAEIKLSQSKTTINSVSSMTRLKRHLRSLRHPATLFELDNALY